jgi:plasmid maintenance system antidote protein VapI
MSLIFDERNVATILNDAIEAERNVTQRQIAEHAGLERPNVIYMFKTGLTKIPLDKAGKVVELLGLDQNEFWFKCFREYMPGAFAEYERVTKQPILTDDEIRAVKAARLEKKNLLDIVKKSIK